MTGRLSGWVGAGVLTMSLVAGCGGPGYINIPAASGDVAGNSANSKTARKVVAVAVEAVITQTPITGKVVLTLSSDAEALTLAGIVAEMGETGEQILPADTEAPADAGTIRITGVRVRGSDAQVDLVRAKAGGPEQLVTVHLHWAAFDKWRFDRIRAWRIPVPD